MNISVPVAFVLLMIVTSLVAMVARRWDFPYTVALVLVGLLLSAVRERLLPGFDIGLHLTADLLFTVFLPVLIFEAAFHFNLRDFLDNWKAIFTLAAPGLVVAVVLAGALVYWIGKMLGFALPFGGALLVASMLSATDPVAVISLMREVGAPHRLSVLMEGESLVNDGVAVVVFGVVLGLLGLDPAVSEVGPVYVLRFLGWELLGAVLIGGAVGAAVSWVTARVDDHLIEITLTTVAAYASFLFADKVHASGVLACLVAGMLTGNFGAMYGMSATTRVAVGTFWEYLAFLANSFVFLLMGLEIVPSRLLVNAPVILLVWLALLASRAVLMGSALPLVEKLEGKLPRWSAAALTWGGLRGGIAMVLALSIPRGWPFRSLAMDIVFGTCLLTIVVQGVSMRKLLGWAGLSKDRLGVRAVEEIRGRLRAIQAALRHLAHQRETGTVDEEMYGQLHSELTEELKQIEAQRAETKDIEQQVREQELLEHRRQLLLVRKAALRDAMVDGQIGEKVARRLIGQVDEQLHKLHRSP
ncbi:MAG: Na+/H+ antiporter [Deltaproteobacteria bacterium]|nr:MAG: Na+/H+ antiporter [Deltaproteobacteria bacterium]